MHAPSHLSYAILVLRMVVLSLKIMLDYGRGTLKASCIQKIANTLTGDALRARDRRSEGIKSVEIY